MAANGSMGSPLPGLSRAALADARLALALLLVINLFNYIDRQMLAAVVPSIKEEYFSSGDSLRDFKVGILNTAFMVTYMVLSPVFSWLADRYSRWWLIGFAVAFWSL